MSDKIFQSQKYKNVYEISLSKGRMRHDKYQVVYVTGTSVGVNDPKADDIRLIPFCSVTDEIESWQLYGLDKGFIESAFAWNIGDDAEEDIISLFNRVNEKEMRKMIEGLSQRLQSLKFEEEMTMSNIEIMKRSYKESYGHDYDKL